jgi:ribonuclease BN (tRNA processing enzyme)
MVRRYPVGRYRGEMRMTVLGGCGAWPAAAQACSGYLVERDGFRLLLDPGYAILPRLLALARAESIDAVLVSHRHPDHCADLHPLLRARRMAPEPPAALPVYALPGAVDAVLALDSPAAMAGTVAVRDFAAGDRFEVGPFQVDTWALPHSVPNAGLRLAAGGRVLAFTGDTGPSEEIVALARGADLFLAEATYPDQVPAPAARYLSTGRQAGQNAVRAGVGRLVLTHLWPGLEPDTVARAARRAYDGELSVARPGLVVDLVSNSRAGQPAAE